MANIFSDNGAVFELKNVPGLSQNLIVRSDSLNADNAFVLIPGSDGNVRELKLAEYFSKFHKNFYKSPTAGSENWEGSELYAEFKEACDSALDRIEKDSHTHGDFLDVGNHDATTLYYLFKAQSNLFNVAGGASKPTKIKVEFEHLDDEYKADLTVRKDKDTGKIEIVGASNAPDDDLDTFVYAEQNKGGNHPIKNLKYTAGVETHIGKDKTSGSKAVKVKHDKVNGGVVHIANHKINLSFDITVEPETIRNDQSIGEHNFTIDINGETVQGVLKQKKVTIGASAGIAGIGASSGVTTTELQLSDASKNKYFKIGGNKITLEDIFTTNEVKQDLAEVLTMMTPTQEIKNVSQALKNATEPLDEKNALIVVPSIDLHNKFKDTFGRYKRLALYRDGNDVYASVITLDSDTNNKEHVVSKGEPQKLGAFVEEMLEDFSLSDRTTKRAEFFKIINDAFKQPIVTIDQGNQLNHAFVADMKTAGDDDKARKGVIRTHEGGIQTSADIKQSKQAPAGGDRETGKATADAGQDLVIKTLDKMGGILNNVAGRLEALEQNKANPAPATDPDPAPAKRTEQPTPPVTPKSDNNKPTTQNRNGDAPAFAGGDRASRSGLGASGIVGIIGGAAAWFLGAGEKAAAAVALITGIGNYCFGWDKMLTGKSLERGNGHPLVSQPMAQGMGTA